MNFSRKQYEKNDGGGVLCPRSDYSGNWVTCARLTVHAPVGNARRAAEIIIRL